MNALERLREIDRETKTLRTTEALLGWDQQVYMPERAVSHRAEQLTLLTKLIHERETSAEIGRLLEQLGVSDEEPLGSADLAPNDRAFVRAFYRDYRQAIKLPTELVARIAKTTAIAHSVWAEARKKSDFSLFAPHLRQIIDLMIQVADKLGYDEHPYDALLDQFEPEMTTQDVAHTFAELRAGLVPLVRKITEARQVDDRMLRLDYPEADQEAFGRKVLASMSFDFDRGRLDRAVHPFTTTLGEHDVRLTTRYNANQFKTALFGTIHEGGHGLYELGFSPDFHGTRLADASSLGIHESMSRFWENVIGRSRPFWHHFFPLLKEEFPDQLSGVDVEQFYRAVNKVAPSHIRVEADEVTYSLHIILRYELERMLVSGELLVKDLPDAWREQSKDLLGIVPEHDSDGVLQDVHWSSGLVGYFPTYALGNVYGLQFVSKLRSDLPDMDNQVRNGEFGNIKQWLDTHVHQKGRTRTPKELCSEVAGESLNAEHYIRYLNEKYHEVYGLGE